MIDIHNIFFKTLEINKKREKVLLKNRQKTKKTNKNDI